MSSLNDAEGFWRVIKDLTDDINLAANNKISDFRNISDLLTSEYAFTNDRYSALFEMLARFKTSDIGQQIQEEFDAHGEDLKFNEQKITVIEEFESEFSFLFEPQIFVSADKQEIKTNRPFDSDLIRAVLGTKGSSVESLRERKANLMKDYLKTLRKIMDDAELRIFAPQTTITEVAERAGKNGGQQAFTSWMQEQRTAREKKKEDKKNA